MCLHVNTCLKVINEFNIVAKQMQKKGERQPMAINMVSDSHLFKHSRLVHFLPRNVTHFEDTQSKRFEGRLLNKVRVVDVQTGEHCLCQGVTFQPSDLEIHKYTLVLL